MITYGSVCSGIESATVAWSPLGMSASWFSEIEPFPCSVLAEHYPDVPNLGDMTILPDMVRMNLIEAPDVLVGGTPCQAFSVAGKRDSLSDARGGLTLIYGDLLNAIDEQRQDGDECVAVWENVPGVLNTKDNAFGYFLGLLAGEYTLVDAISGRAEPLEAQPGANRQKWSKSGCVIGPKRTVAWRVIDAQYFGLAQRRKRVFVVASARKDFDPAKVLFESEGVRRDSPPRRETQQDVTNPTAHSVGALCARTCQSISSQDAQQGHLLVAQDPAYCLETTCNDYSRADGFNMVVHGTQDPCVSDVAFALGRNNGGENVLAIHDKATRYSGGGNTRDGDGSGNGLGVSKPNDPMFTLTCGDRHAVNHKGVRRLTPVECERLQGFPDNYTNVTHRGKPAADGPRYKALGNSKATNCVQWLGVRIILERTGLL